MVESRTRSRASEMREVKQLWHECKGGQQERMLGPRTVLNGGEREQEHAFFFSCIAERARSIVGQLLETWNELVLIECKIFTRPTQDKTNQHKPKQNATHETSKNQPTRSCEISPKDVRQRWNDMPCDLFHHVVILHAIRVIFRCPSCLRLPFLAQAGLSHPAGVDVAWAGKCPLWSATSLYNVP